MILGDCGSERRYATRLHVWSVDSVCCSGMYSWKYEDKEGPDKARYGDRIVHKGCGATTVMTLSTGADFPRTLFPGFGDHSSGTIFPGDTFSRGTIISVTPVLNLYYTVSKLVLVLLPIGKA